MENIDVKALLRHLRILKFLVSFNSAVDEIYLEETTETHLSSLIKFEVVPKIKCLSGFLSSTKAFDELLNEKSVKYLGVKSDQFEYNNTRTVFWINKDKIIT